MKSLGKRLLNEDLDEYLKGPIGGEAVDGDDEYDPDCINCATCVAKSHRVLRFKYPKGMSTRY